MTRRGNGEGTISRHPDGRWWARLSYYEGGKRKRKAIYGRTRQEVAARLARALREQQDGLPVANERLTVARYLERWLEDAVRHSVRASTYESYRRLLARHVTPHIGRHALAKLAPQHLTQLYATLLDHGLSARTVQYAHAVLHRALKQAQRWNLVARNVADLVDAPRPERQEMPSLSPEQARQLLAAAREDRLYALYVLALTTGMRLGELLGLRWGDVNLSKGELAVRRQVQRLRGALVFSEPKTARGRRTIALPRLAIDALRQHRTAQLEERLQAGPLWQDGDLVFASTIGSPIERSNLLRRSFWPLLARAGLPRIRFHDLRHSAASLLLAMGEHPKVVQERLGHATIAVTMDVYSHVMPQMQRAAADKLDDLLAEQ